MRNSSPSRAVELLLVAALFVAGAGCDLGSKISLQLPFKLEPSAVADPSVASRSLGLKAGTRLSLRPTYLGVTGSIDDLIGTADGKRDIQLTSFDPRASIGIAWSEGAKKGTVTATGAADARTMLLPSFWKEGDATVDGNGLLWMSPAAFSELDSASTTEWRLGVAETALAPLSKALQTFDAVSAALFRSATSTATAALRGPFMIEKKAKATFPLLVDGRIENLGVIQASGWFADYVILDDPDDPLILKVNVNPLAAQALQSFADAGVDPKTIGYEIVSLTRE